MSVLKRTELQDSPLADLHAIASELGLEGFRSKRKNELIDAILDASGGVEDEPDDEPVEQAEQTSEDTSEGTSEDTSEGTSEDTSEGTSEDTSEGTSEGTSGEGEEVVEEEPEVVEDEISDDEIAAGVLDVLANGSGFMRVDAAGQSRGDVYVSPAQIRRCELRAGDDVSGPARRPRRNERHPSLVRVETVNGAPAEPAEERPWFGDLTAVFPTQK